jgi:lipase
MGLHVHHLGPDDGRPLVALHGLTGHGRGWRAFAGEQLPGFRVHAPDLRGNGLSPTVPPWTLEQHAADVLAVLDRAGLDPPAFDTPADGARSLPPWLGEDEIEHHLHRGTDGRWRWRYSPAAAVTAFSELARPAVPPPPGTPTLLVLARTDRGDQYAYAGLCRAALGDDLTLAELDSGHHLHQQRPAETGALTRDFLTPGRTPG